MVLLMSTVWLYAQLQKSNQSLASISNRIKEIEDKNGELAQELFETNKWYDAINQPSTSKITLKGNEVSPSSLAISYVNHDRKSVIVNTAGLASLSGAEDYQMWADVDGVMIDMGVIPRKASMVEMQYIENAASLNITIEPKGGSEHPTVSKLIANVYL